MENFKFKILPMQFPEDKKQIAEWETKYANTEGMKQITHFILEDNLYHGLAEVVETNHEIHHIGNDEKKLAFSVKTPEGEILAWVLLDVFDITSKKPQMFIQYIVVSPAYHGKGLGTEIMKEVVLNTKQLTGVKPAEIMAYVEAENTSSLMLFSKFNFHFEPMQNSTYFRAETNEPKFLPAEMNGGTFGY